jgi:hypothetical protein
MRQLLAYRLCACKAEFQVVGDVQGIPSFGRKLVPEKQPWMSGNVPVSFPALLHAVHQATVVLLKYRYRRLPGT